MEDVRISRKTRTTQTRVHLPANTSTVLVPADKKRMSVVFGASPLQAFNISFAETADATLDMNIPQNSAPIAFDWHHDGAMVQNRITAICAAGAIDLCVWETFLNEE